MDKKPDLKKILTIVTTALTILVGVFFLVALGTVYFPNAEKAYIYTEDTIAPAKPFLYVGFILLALCFVISIVMFFLCRSQEKNKLKRGNKDLYLQIREHKAIEESDSENYKTLKDLEKKSLIVLLSDLVLSLGIAVFPLCYLFNFSNFDPNYSLWEEAVSMAIHTVPFLLAIYILNVIRLYWEDTIYQQKVKLLLSKGKNISSEKDLRKEKRIINIVRGVVFVLAVTFIILGIANGEVQNVISKAVNICTECIGLG